MLVFDGHARIRPVEGPKFYKRGAVLLYFRSGGAAFRPAGIGFALEKNLTDLTKKNSFAQGKQYPWT